MRYVIYGAGAIGGTIGGRLFEAGVSTPILVPSSTSGGQLKAFEELFEAFS